MSSNIKINKVCQHCGAEFIAQTTKTKYCSHKCANRAYKARQRDGKLKASLKETIQIKNDYSIEELKEKEFLNVREVAKLIGCSRQTVYNLINSGNLKATNILKKKTIVRRSDIEKLFEQPEPQQQKEEYEYNITINEAIEKYKISDKAFYDLRKRHNIPKIKKGKFTYIPESLIKQYLNS
ncbi:MAG: helix-turn-helix domain-containing protein [Bacteroidales bacterium]